MASPASGASKPGFLSRAKSFANTAGQAASTGGTALTAAGSNADAMMSEKKMFALVHEAREQGLWSVATKQADAQSSRMAKQSEAWAQI